MVKMNDLKSTVMEHDKGERVVGRCCCHAGSAGSFERRIFRMAATTSSSI